MLSGLLGVGGGIIMVPLQVVWAGVRPHQASGTSLLALLPIALVGVLIYFFGSAQHPVDLRLAAILTIGSVFGAYVGARLVNRVPEVWMARMVALVLVLVGLRELVLG